MEGGIEKINYQDGPGSVRQVIAVDSPVCHIVNLSLSPGPFHYSTPYLYIAQSVCIGTCPDTISVSLSLFLSLAVELCRQQDMSSHVSSSRCTLHVLIFPIV